jgi:hypothetical protein
MSYLAAVRMYFGKLEKCNPGLLEEDPVPPVFADSNKVSIPICSLSQRGGKSADLIL